MTHNSYEINLTFILYRYHPKVTFRILGEVLGGQLGEDP